MLAHEQVHRFLEELRRSGAAKVGPREHTLVQRLLEIPRPEHEVPLAVAAVLATEEAQLARIRGLWEQRFGAAVVVTAPDGTKRVEIEPPPPVPPREEGSRGWWWWLAVFASVGGVLLALVVTLRVSEPEPVPSTVDTQVTPPVEPAVEPEPEVRGAELVQEVAASRTKAEAPPTGEFVQAGSAFQRGAAFAGAAAFAAAGALLLSLVAGARREQRDRKAAADAARAELLAGSKVFPALHVVQPLRPFSPAVMDLAASELGRVAHELDGAAWDVPATVDASSRAAGRLVPRYAPRRHGVPVLAIVDREGGDHPFLHVYDGLLGYWDQSGVPFERWDFTGWLDRLTNAAGESTTVAALVRHRADAVVLVFTRQHDPYPFVGERISWVTQLAPWAGRAVLLDPDPRPLADRYPDVVPTDGPPHLPLSKDGLLAAVRWLKEGGTAKAEWPASAPTGEALDRWAAIATLVPRPRWAHLDDLRRAFLGDDLHWRDVIPLLRHLGVPHEDRGAEFDADRRGMAMLEALREREPELERSVRRRLMEQLKARAKELEEQGHGYAAKVAELKVAMHGAALGERDLRALLELLGTAVAPEAEQLLEEEVGIALSPFSEVQIREVQAVLAGQGTTPGGSWAGLRIWRLAAVLLLALAATAASGEAWRRGAVAEVPPRLVEVQVPATYRIVLPEEAAPPPPPPAPVEADPDVCLAAAEAEWARRLEADRARLLAEATERWQELAGCEKAIDAVLREQCKTRLTAFLAMVKGLRARVPAGRWQGQAPESPMACDVTMAERFDAVTVRPAVLAAAALDMLNLRQLPMIRVPGGTFVMGSPDGEGDDYEHPAQRVRVSTFLISTTEVTQGQWEAVTGQYPSDCDYGCGDNLPVQNVSWLDAVAFLNALSEQEGLEPCYAVEGEDVRWPKGVACEGYRLPTEAEWEYAARAGTTTKWSWGDDESAAGTYAWFSGNSGGKAHPVGTKAANPLGVRDMHGNVWEWVWDGYGRYPRGTPIDTQVTWSDRALAPPVRVNPTGESGATVRVLRGGSFFNVPVSLRSANRLRNVPGSRLADYGLRCVRTSLAPP